MTFNKPAFISQTRISSLSSYVPSLEEPSSSSSSSHEFLLLLLLLGLFARNSSSDDESISTTSIELALGFGFLFLDVDLRFDRPLDFSLDALFFFFVLVTSRGVLSPLFLEDFRGKCA